LIPEVVFHPCGYVIMYHYVERDQKVAWTVLWPLNGAPRASINRLVIGCSQEGCYGFWADL
jgi:hypothetical protein